MTRACSRVHTATVIVVAIAALAATLTPGTASATFPGADGRILFQRYSPQYGAFTVAPDGSDVRRLQPRLGPSGGWDGQVDMSWSANGRWIVYTCYPAWAVYTQLCIMRADGSDSRSVGQVAEGYDPSFSPGGGKIVYSEAPMHAAPTGGIYVINVDGSHRHLLIRPRDACCARWAPNGKHIVYNAYPGIWRVSPDGSHPRQLSSIGDSPRYTPDNSILFEENGTTMLMGGGGRNPHPIDTEPIDSDAQVAPAGGCLFGTVEGQQTTDLYARGTRCPASGRLIKNALDPSWQPLP